MKINSRKSVLLIGLLLLSSFLAACGQKGPLRHPKADSKTMTQEP